jgi:ATP-dependent Clp protease ATP-binding subunit ClpC
VGKVNVYLPDDLERAVRDAGVPVSPVCQTALRTAVDTILGLRSARATGPAAPFSPRLAEVIDGLRASGRPAGSLELLGAVITHGENLGARVLLDLGVELPPPARGRRGKAADGPDVLTADAREVLAAAYLVALELRHEHVGTEHVVIAIAARDDTAAGLLRVLGLDARTIRARVEQRVADELRQVRANM